MSVIDLAICRFEDIEIKENFKTMNIVSGSDHDLIEVKLKYEENRIEKEECISWKQHKAMDYKRIIEKKKLVIKNANTVNEKCKEINTAIKDAAKEAGMYKRKKDRGQKECEWYDNECKEKKER